ncbi:MAG: hypothetical protein RL069_774 [Planctomycetota bacterium]|jgi:hypothetical protein
MISDPVLLAYLDESLANEKMVEVELAIRNEPQLRQRLSQLIAQRDVGVHSIGDIWRRNRLSCPSREALGSFLLGAMLDQTAQYIQFHIETLGCRYCQANLEDLKAKAKATEESVADTRAAEALARRRKIFQSSVGRIQSNPRSS